MKKLFLPREAPINFLPSVYLNIDCSLETNVDVVMKNNA